MQLAELGRRAPPVADVRFVPDLPVPRLDFGASVFLHAMFCPLEDQLGPLGIVLGRVGPAGVNLVVLRLGRPLVLVRLGLHGHLLGHEASLQEARRSQQGRRRHHAAARNDISQLDDLDAINAQWC